MSVYMSNHLTAYIESLLNTADYYAYLIAKPIIIARWNALYNFLSINNTDITTSYFQPNAWVDLFFNYCGIIWCFFMVGTFFIFIAQRTFKDITSGKDNFLANYVHLDDLEEEVGSIDDGAYYIIFFMLLIGWFYYFTVFARFFIIKHQLFILTIFMIILLSGVVVPSALLGQMGLQFTQFVRGSGRSANIIFETILDAVAVSVIMIRFFVQNIRFVFIFLAFFELYEFILDLTLVNPLTLNCRVSWSDAVAHIHQHGPATYIFIKLFVTWFQYLYYLGHLTILFMIQLGIYFVLSFWLYFFLYTTFFLESQEKYFFIKRAFN